MTKSCITIAPGETAVGWKYRASRYHNVEDALQELLPRTMDTNPVLSHAVHQIILARITIDNLMKEAAEPAYEDE